MLKDRDSSAIVAVRDLLRARDFYSGVLGLQLSAQAGGEGVLTFKTGRTRLIVYQSEMAGTNRANAVVWDCGGDFDRIMTHLEAQGVEFDHYPELGLRIEGNVHRAGEAKLAWFKDPDGNILHLISM